MVLGIKPSLRHAKEKQIPAAKTSNTNTAQKKKTKTP